MNIITKKVEFNFSELQEIRDLLNPVIHKRDDVLESYIDAENNVYKIGIRIGASQKPFQELINKYAIPKAAVSFFDTTPVKLSATTLRDYYRPLMGGLQILNGNSGLCTFGFNVKLNNEDRWITNSHCTNQYSSNDNTNFYQNTVSSLNYIGTEYRDFEGYGSPGNRYRYADAALIDKATNVPTYFGAITPTSSYTNNWGNTGSLLIVEENPGQASPFNISGELPPFQNLSVHKMGRTTGWTTGYILANCADVSNITGLPGWTIRCQIRSDVYTGGGDSGSPVFVPSLTNPDPSNLNVDLIGIHWGHNTFQQVSFHSPISAVRNELTQGSETLTTH